MKTIGLLTGGGDCPGLNAVIHTVVRAGLKAGIETVGVRNGWLGLIDRDVEPLTDFAISGILPKGGTILGTSRTDPLKNPEDFQKIKSSMQRYGFDGLIVIGGNGTLSAAARVSEKGIPIIGIPKTIDNDVYGTDMTVGFDTAVNIVTEAIDRLHSTAESHHRIMVLEVMGRDVGWIALMAGIAGGADIILVPEIPFSMDNVVKHLKDRYGAGKKFSIIAVAEGVSPEDIGAQPLPEGYHSNCGHSRFDCIGHSLGKELEKHTGIETRVTILGHVQRGGSPTPYDRILATRFGAAAIDLVQTGEYGKMVALRGSKITSVPLSEVGGKKKTVDLALYELAKTATWGSV